MGNLQDERVGRMQSIVSVREHCIAFVIIRTLASYYIRAQSSQDEWSWVERHDSEYASNVPCQRLTVASLRGKNRVVYSGMID